MLFIINESANRPTTALQMQQQQEPFICEVRTVVDSTTACNAIAQEYVPTIGILVRISNMQTARVRFFTNCF